MKTLLFGSLSALLVGAIAVPAIAVPAVRTDAIAQANAQLKQRTQTGRSLSVAVPGEETLYLNRNTAYPQNLRLRTATSVNGRNLPVGTIVRGSFEPIEGGLRYVADSVEIGDRIYNLSAASDVLHDVKDPRETRVGNILTDAAIGAAGGYVIGEVLGRPDLLEVLGGAAAGATVGNVTAPRVVVIRPEDPITLYSR